MKKLFLSAGVSALLATSALADVTQSYQECRQSNGRLGWFVVTYTVYPKPAPTGHRIPTSTEDMKQSCSAADYEDSRQAAANWGENWPSLPSQPADTTTGRQTSGGTPRVNGTQGAVPDRGGSDRTSDAEGRRNSSGGTSDRGRGSADFDGPSGRGERGNRIGTLFPDRGGGFGGRFPDARGIGGNSPNGQSVELDASPRRITTRQGQGVARPRHNPGPQGSPRVERPMPGGLRRPFDRLNRPMLGSRFEGRPRPAFGSGGFVRPFSRFAPGPRLGGRFTTGLSPRERLFR
jgi:hypothetical protein